jgi:Fuc2NAc and GlcNAc transferase
MSYILEELSYFSAGFFIASCLIVVLSAWLTRFYRSFAINKEIISNPNNRSLHKYFKPSGGGIVFSLICVFFVSILSFLEVVGFEMLMVFGLGAFCAAIFGFIDDIYDINPLLKLIIQVVLSIWALVWLNVSELAILSWLPFWASLILCCFLLVWMMNLYNFMDGIDGMAASGTIFACFALVVTLILTSGFSSLVIILSLLLSSCLGFLIYNWPPASIFMGDAGSIFLGYFFGSLIIISLIEGDISLWTWVIVFSYFFGDTNVTIIMRLILSKKWYKPHRSHGYQNLARILDNHKKVTVGVQVYNVFYILPLAVFSVVMPLWAAFFSILAIAPVIFFTLWFGPKYSIE